MSTRALLLAGGLGTRLKPITDTIPKCLVPIAGRPLLDYWFDRLHDAQIRDVRINTHHHFQQVRQYIREKNQAGYFNVSEAYEPVLLGSAGTVHANRDWIRPGDTALIIYADNLSDINLGSFIEFHESRRQPMTMLLFHTPYPSKCGIAAMNGNDIITEFVEKPTNPKSDLANGGIYAFTSEAFHKAADMGKFDMAFDVLPHFVGQMCGWVWNGYHRDIGSLESLKAAQTDIASLPSFKKSA